MSVNAVRHRSVPLRIAWAGIATMAILAALIYWRFLSPMRFDRQAWQAEKMPGMFSSTRDRMADDVAAHVLKRGMHWTVVRGLLDEMPSGKPPEQLSDSYRKDFKDAEPGDLMDGWLCRTGPSSMFHTYLEVLYGPDGLFKEAHVWRT